MKNWMRKSLCVGFLAAGVLAMTAGGAQAAGDTQGKGNKGGSHHSWDNGCHRGDSASTSIRVGDDIYVCIREGEEEEDDE